LQRQNPWNGLARKALAEGLLSKNKVMGEENHA
jgi:hypothetical protein